MNKKHLYEIDFMRFFFIIGVLAIHTIGIVKKQFDPTSLTYQIFGGLHASFHFTRTSFMFVSGLVLFFSLSHRPVSLLKFWRKRFWLIGIPYLAWNLVYLMLHGQSPLTLTFYQQLGPHLLHGDLGYLYYVLVTMQLYLIIPPLFKWLQHNQRYHRVILYSSFWCQILITLLIKFVIPHLDTSHWPYLLSHYGVFVGTYQFYFIAGAITCLNYQELTEWLDSHGPKLIHLLWIAVPAIWLYYYYDRFILHLGDIASKSVHQPLFVLYACLFILIILYLGRRWAAHRLEPHWRWFSKWVALGAQLSFGIYLAQPIAITGFKWFLANTHLSTLALILITPIALLVIYGLSFGIAYLCYQTPYLAYCIGRPKKILKTRSSSCLNSAQPCKNNSYNQ